MRRDKILKEVRSWGIFLVVFLILFKTEIGKEITSTVQRAVLYTGLFSVNQESDFQKIPGAYSIAVVPLSNEALISAPLNTGKPVLINFWATWCSPCIAEMPYLQNIYDDYRDTGLEVMMVSTDDDLDKIRKFIQKKEYTFPVYQLAYALDPPLAARSIPTTYLIDREGNIVVHHEGMANYDSKKFRQLLDSVLNE